MKKALRILSIINCISCVFVLLMLLLPAINGYDDGVGLFLEFISIVLSSITFFLWMIFSIFHKYNIELKIMAIFSVLLYAGVIVSIFGDIIPFKFPVFLLMWIIPIVFNVLFITHSK